MRGKVLATATFGSGGALDKCRNIVSSASRCGNGRHLFSYVYISTRSTVVRLFMIDNPFQFFFTELSWWRLGPLYN
jgi:hypothetical protein